MFRWTEKPRALARALSVWLAVVYRRQDPLAAVLDVRDRLSRRVSSAPPWSVCIRTVTLGLWRAVKVAAVVFACALILAVGLGVVFFSLQAFFDSYGILGVIVILLGLIVIQLQRLISTGHGLNPVTHPAGRVPTNQR